MISQYVRTLFSNCPIVLSFCVLATVLVAPKANAVQDIAPVAGRWDYAYNRCNVPRKGYATEKAAVNAGAAEYFDHGCGWSVENPRHWGTPQNQTFGSCGSSQKYPKFNLGVEYINTRHYSILSVWPGCNHQVTDGLTIYRERSVDCTQGYSWNGSACSANGPNPHKNNSVCPAGPNGSNPIHTKLGYKLQTELDYRGASSFALSFTRYYSSGTHWESTSLGQNWRHSYARRIAVVSASSVTTATVYRASGDRFYFNLDVDGNWVGDADVVGRLVELQDQSGNTTGWQYKNAQDQAENYGASGQLISITNVNGLSQSLTYEFGRLKSVSDAFGRSLIFGYDSENRLETITDPDGHVLTYRYAPNGLLGSVTYPSSSSRIYHYEDSNFPYALTGITDENEDRYATWTYDPQGRAVSSEHAGGADRTTLAYNTDGTTTVTNPLDKQTTYHFDLIHGVYKVTQVEGHASAHCAAANQAYTYDANGYPDQVTDWNGRITDHDYNLRGLEERRVEALNTPEERTITTEWHTDFRLPTRITEPGRETEFQYDTQGQLLSRTVRPAP